MAWNKITVYTSTRGPWRLRVFQHRGRWHYSIWHAKDFHEGRSDRGYPTPTHAQAECLKDLERLKAEVRQLPSPAVPEAHP